jgi:hypothetical protein
MSTSLSWSKANQHYLTRALKSARDKVDHSGGSAHITETTGEKAAGKFFDVHSWKR